jgi:tRNA(Ile)-lysidine synthase
LRVARPTLDACVRRLGEQTDLTATAVRPLLAVSGGPDSVAMLVMMAALRPGRFAAATVDHGLRPEAAAEAALVAQLCAERDVPHATLTPAEPIAAPAPDPLVGQSWTVGGPIDSVALPVRTSLQGRARNARYDLLTEHARATGCDVLFTAHHRDDQAETFLMRASRGSGVDGLAGVRRTTRWRDVPVFRPLLDWQRSDLADVLRAAEVEAANDPSNQDPAYDRTRIRALLAGAPELRIDGLVRSAAALADASEALRWTAEIVAQQRIEEQGDALLLDIAKLPRELQRRVLALAIEQQGARAPRGPTLDHVLRDLAGGARSSLGTLLVEPAADGRWAVRPSPPRRTG